METSTPAPALRISLYFIFFLFFPLTFRISYLRADKMDWGWACELAKLEGLGLVLGLHMADGKVDSFKLSSDHHMCAVHL